MILKKAHFAAACTENDDLADNTYHENSILMLCNALDVDNSDLMYVANQRALRIILMQRGGEFNPVGPISLTPEEEKSCTLFTACWIDAALTALKAYKATHVDGQHKRKTSR